MGATLIQESSDQRLRQILEALDASINSAIARPDCAGGESLRHAEALCRNLSRNGGLRLPGGTEETKTAERVALIWQIRSRVGRLKMLLDSAADFYRGISRQSITEMDYNAEGKREENSTGSLLCLDC